MPGIYEWVASPLIVGVALLALNHAKDRAGDRARAREAAKIAREQQQEAEAQARADAAKVEAALLEGFRRNNWKLWHLIGDANRDATRALNWLREGKYPQVEFALCDIIDHTDPKTALVEPSVTPPKE